VTGAHGPSRAEAQRAGAEACRPIISALEKYHAAHGRYPDALDDLVSSKLLDRIPDAPEIGQSRRGGVTYEVSPPLDVYRLSFAYDVDEGFIGAIVRFSYMSDVARWEGRKYPPDFWSETCDRAAKRFRAKRDDASLRTVVEVMPSSPDFPYFHESRVQEWLGEGEPTAIPRDVSDGPRKGSCYGTTDGPTRLCFTYRSHVLPMLDGKKQDFPIVDTLYLIESRDGSETWKVLLKNPQKE
jgi:hypothetical protein